MWEQVVSRSRVWGIEAAQPGVSAVALRSLWPHFWYSNPKVRNDINFTAPQTDMQPHVGPFQKEPDLNWGPGL